MKNFDYDQHHIIQKRVRDRYNVFDERNTMKIKVIQHRGLHALFENFYTPKWQIQQMRDLYKNVLSDNVLNMIDYILSLPVSERYQEWIVKKSLLYNERKWKTIPL